MGVTDHSCIMIRAIIIIVVLVSMWTAADPIQMDTEYLDEMDPPALDGDDLFQIDTEDLDEMDPPALAGDDLVQMDTEDDDNIPPPLFDFPDYPSPPQMDASYENIY